jgi:signal transduction histidine kinase
MILRWFGSLAGRLTLLILASLLCAQLIGVLVFVRSQEHERSEQAGEGFVRAIAGVVENFNRSPDLDRNGYLATVRQPGWFFWLSDIPAVPTQGITIADDGPHRPGNWGLIKSPDKRLTWFEDERPLTMRWRIAAIPTIRNLPHVPEGEGPPDERPPPRGADRPPPPATKYTAATLSSDRDGPPPIPDPTHSRVNRPKPYGEGTSFFPPPPGNILPPVRWRAAVQLADGDWLNAEHLYENGLPPWLSTVMFQNGVILAIMMLFVVPVVAFATHRLTQLARVADRLGRGEDTEPLPESGTNEIVRLTQAFNQMSLRLRRFVQGRTQMLAGISHDLRTPITALRLRADLVDDDENRDRMLALIDDMHHLTEATLTLARDDSFTEKTDIVDISSLVEGVCDDLTDAGVDAVADVERGVNLTCRPYSLRRAIRNLAENGAKYGKRARITMNGDAATVRIVVDDDGPGIPDDMVEKAFQPFVRLEGSRSRETGGSGLGLAITRSIVLNHGGDISLKNRPGGGLRAVISLPKPELV